jgi:hypothetical protein
MLTPADVAGAHDLDAPAGGRMQKRFGKPTEIIVKTEERPSA